MTHEEYEQRKRRLEEELRAGVALLETAFRHQIRALQLVWAAAGGDDVEIPPQVVALPGVQSAAAIDNLPMEGGSEQPIAVEGRLAEVFALQRNVSVREITPNYFRTMSIPLLAGRDIESADGARRDVGAGIDQLWAMVDVHSAV